MPQIERKELGRINIVDDTLVTTAKLDLASASAAKIFGGGIISFGPNVVEESIQITATDNKTGASVNITSGTGTKLGFYRGTSPGNTLYRGNICAYITSIKQQTFYVDDCENLERIAPGINSSGTLAFDNDCVKINNSTARWNCGGEPGFSALFTYVRPYETRIVNQFGASVVDWLPYDITVVATGYELNDYVQDTGENEEVISCLVIDPNSKTLYGERPSQSEEQSDFIETQLQACRVAENMIWQQNKVLEVSFSIPFRPAIRRGQTIRVLQPSKSIDFLGIVKSFSHDFDFESATVTTVIQSTTTEYLFETASGLKNSEDKIDLRV